MTAALATDVGPPGDDAPVPALADGMEWAELAERIADEAGVLDALREGREDVDTVSVIAGIARVRAALYGVELAYTARLVGQREAELRREAAARGRSSGPGVLKDTLDQVSTEVSLALRIHPQTANGVVDAALALRRLPDTRQALETGAISATHLDHILHHAGRLVDRDEHTPDFDRAIAAFAVRHVPGRTKKEANRLVTALEPDRAAERERAAEEGRGVEFHVGEDGMEELTAELPADDMAAVREAMDRVVDHAKTLAGEDRTVHQLRADLLGAWARAALEYGDALPGHCPGCACEHSAATPRATQKGEAFLLAGARSGGRAVPFLRIAISAAALAGLGDLPAELARHGAITADWVRRLAAALLAQGGSIPAELVVTDEGGRPVTPIQDRDPAYRPRASTAREVRGRDGTCRVEGCHQPARYGDLDHTRSWDGDPDGSGPTHPGNLAVLCRAHHEEKTKGLWKLSQATTPSPGLDGTGYEATGQMTITTSTGRTYTSRPDPLPHDAPPF